MGSPNAVISLGFGTWGSVAEVVTLGYGSGEAAVVRVDAGAFRLDAYGSPARIDDNLGSPARIGT